MRSILQSTSRVVMFKAFLSSDHISPATGKTIAVVISKNGGAFGNPNAGATNATEVSSGWYKVTLDTTDTNTVGDLVIRATEGTIDAAEQILNVVANLATQLTTIEGKIDTVDTVVDGIDSDTNTLLTNLATVDTVVDGIASDLSTIESKIDTVDTVVDTITTNLATVDTVVDGIAVAVAVVDTVVDGIAVAVATVDTVVDGIATAVGEVDGKIEDLLANVAGITSTTNNIDSNVNGIVVTLAALDVPTASEVADEIFTGSNRIEADWTFQHTMRVVLAVLAGPTTDMDTTTAVIQNPAGTKDRVTATTDEFGNRSGIAYDKT